VSPASLAVPAYAGVPLTTRGHDRIAVIRADDAKCDWSAYTGDNTLVLLVPPKTELTSCVATAAGALIGAGRAADTPVSVTVHGTTTAQSTIVSTLAAVAADLAAVPVPDDDESLGGETVVVVGSVVDLREQLSWFETRPLFGWRVLVPRTKDQAVELSEHLQVHGAVPEEVPTISVEPPRNPQQMDKAVRGLVEGRYEWVAFTSVNAVRAVREKFDEYGLDARAFSGLKVAAVGEGDRAGHRHLGDPA
jgi:uroporphyrinogen III methyltransferase/synthase